MIRIGLVGSASSHAGIFARLLNVAQIAGDRARISAIWSGSDPERTRQVAAQGQITAVASSLHHLVDEVDAAIIVDRHGDLHAEHALPFLLDGKPVYIDAPFAIDLADCRRMLNAARRSEAAITSFSALSVAPDTEAMKRARLGTVRLAQLAGPCDFGSPHGGPFYSATHLFELALSLLGEGDADLRATRAGDTVVVDAVWQDDTVATLGFSRDAAQTFHASVFGTGGSLSGDVKIDDASHAETLRIAVDMFETGRWPLDSRHLLLPIVIAHAMVESLNRGGGWVDVAAMLDDEVDALR